MKAWQGKSTEDRKYVAKYHEVLISSYNISSQDNFSRFSMRY